LTLWLASFLVMITVRFSFSEPGTAESGTAPSKVTNLPPRFTAKFLCRLQNVVVYVKRGSHAADDIASW
jgi:hypothetical protein